MATLTLPFPTFTAGTPAYANQIQDNYIAIRDHINGQNIGTGNIEATLISRVGGPILFLNQASQEQIALSILNSRTKTALKVQQTGLLSAGSSAIHIDDDAAQTTGAAQLFLDLLATSTIPAILVNHGSAQTMSLTRTQLNMLGTALSLNSSQFNVLNSTLSLSTTQLNLFASAVEISAARVKLPVRTSGQRDAVTQEGSVVYNTDTDQLNVRRSDAWVPVEVPVGSVQMYAGTVAPEGWLLCGDVTLDSVANPQYAKLFAVIGTTYGGTGASNFKLPDTRGRTAIGVGTGTGLTARALAAIGGAETHLLTSAESGQKAITTGASTGLSKGMTSEEAGGGSTNFVVGSTSSEFQGTLNWNHTHSITGSNADQAHNNMQPFIALNYIIKY